ncbi:uncharacterized protein LOC133190484 [Saccostrea echinata]|uniref:uncharacterized protein LOC133190484 n=1 Tax=Saccostrea echinata TaxID=191078 RepID=UPI002A7F6197|nr:uncharacterized protein LOC133190484 [Saccostrea echinata]
MLHVMAHSTSRMAEVVSVHSPGPSTHASISPFSRSLKMISQQLTVEDFSTLKLILQSENLLKKQTLDNLKNPQELLRVLLGRHLVSQENTSLLESHLKEIGRIDLAKLLPSIELCQDGDECLPDENSNSQNSQMSIDEDDDEIMSSQSSISDEEKLMLKKVSE